MPGFELSRFTKASAKEVKEMLCHICQDIFCSPYQTKCCTKTFCETCIKPWIDSNHSCPFDNLPLKHEDLVVPEALLSVLNKQKLKCAFNGKGCTEVVTVENIVDHEKYCVYDKQTCKDCGFLANSEHDCVKALIDYKHHMTSAVKQMRKELDTVTLYNEELRCILENYRRTIKDLSLDRSKQLEAIAKPPASENGTEQVRITSNAELLQEARKNINTITVDSKRTRKDVAEKLVPVVKEAITSKGDKMYDITRTIKEFMDSHFMGDWNVYLVYNNLGLINYNSQSDGYIDMKLGKYVSLVVYKAHDPFGFNRVVSFIKSGAIRDFVVFKSGFDDDATREIEKVALAALKSSVDNTEFTCKVADTLSSNYGGIWHCFMYKGNFGFFNVRALKDRYCIFSSADVKILIFQ